MVNNIQFISSVPEKGVDQFTGYFEIAEKKVHVFLPSNLEAYSSVRHLNCLETKEGIHSQFINCFLYRVGRDFDEYVVETAYLGETFESYNQNMYKSAYFELSNDLLFFFEPPWTYTNSFLDRGSKGLIFKTPEERNRTIIINDNTRFTLTTGYSQSYSNVRYKARSSVLFGIECTEPVNREVMLDYIQSVADYYSLFSQKPVTIQEIKLVNSQGINVEYLGNRLSPSDQTVYFGNTLIEEIDVKNHLDQLPKWINNYSNIKVAMNLIRDASKLSDKQLKFICYVRCLEVFHKENFLNTSKTNEKFFKDLEAFAIEEKLSSVPLSYPGSKKINLIHRLIDLIRSVFDLVKRDRLLFGAFTGLNKAQQIVDTRNYLIHFSDSKKENIIKEDQLAIVNEQLLAVVRVIFLKHFGFEDKTIKGIIGAVWRRLFI